MKHNVYQFEYRTSVEMLVHKIGQIFFGKREQFEEKQIKQKGQNENDIQKTTLKSTAA